MAFSSSDDLVEENEDGSPEVFVRRFGASPLTRQVSHSAVEYRDPPVISGDGSTVVFAEHDADAPNPAARPQLFRYSTLSQETDRFTSTGNNGIDPRPAAVNRDGSVIVFGAGDDVGGLDVRSYDLVRYRPATGEFTNLTRNPEFALARAPSVDDTGSRIVYEESNSFTEDPPRPAGLECDLSSPRPTISGTVTDSSNGAPLQGAWVMAVNAGGALAAGAITTGSGDYSLAVPEGTYRIQTADPSGRHRGEWYDDEDLGGFADAQTVTPTISGPTTVDAALDPIDPPAAITGTVTDDETDAPLAGTWVAALDASGQVRQGAATDASGGYAFEGLRPGEYRVAFIDPSGGHDPELHLDAASFDTAAAVDLAAGATVTVDAGLAPRPSLPTTETVVRGRITGARGVGVDVAWVLAFDTTGRFVRGVESGFFSGGNYQLRLPAGQYKVQILDRFGLHEGEWHDDQRLDAVDDAQVVDTLAQSPATVDAVLAGAGPSGRIAGTVIDDAADTPLQGVWVGVVDVATGALVGNATTDGQGQYTVRSLWAGTYRLAFIDPMGGHHFEFHQDTVDFGAATDVVLEAGQTVDVDAALTPRP